MADPGEQTRSIGRRAALGALAAAGAGIVLYPYRGRSRASIPDGRTVLTYWEKWTGREGVAMQAVVDRFNASQSRLWVHMVPISEIAAKAMVAIGGGDPPDIVGLYTYNIPGYAEAGAVMPLDEFTTPEPLDLFRYTPGIRELLTHEGRQWAGVNTCYTLGLYYNRSMLREAGHTEPPQTISQLDALADTLTRRTAQGRIEQAGFLQNLPGWWPYFWPIMFGGRLYDYANDRAIIAEPACIAAFEWIRDSADRFGPAASSTFAAAFGRSIHSAQDPFITGKVAMIIQGPWLANFIRAYNPTMEYACAPVPVADGLFNPSLPTGLLEADVLMIPRGSPHPQEAYEFLHFTQRTDIQEELATAHCKPSPFIRTSAGFYESHPNPSVRVHDAIAKSPAARILPRTRVWKQYSDLTISAFDAVWAGADPAAELGRVQSRAQELLDTAASRRRLRQAAAAGGAAR